SPTQGAVSVSSVLRKRPLNPGVQLPEAAESCLAEAGLHLAFRGAIAQLGERLDRTQEVAGSSPASSIKQSACKSHVSRALALPGGNPQRGAWQQNGNARTGVLARQLADADRVEAEIARRAQARAEELYLSRAFTAVAASDVPDSAAEPEAAPAVPDAALGQLRERDPAAASALDEMLKRGSQLRTSGRCGRDPVQLFHRGCP